LEWIREKNILDQKKLLRERKGGGMKCGDYKHGTGEGCKGQGIEKAGCRK